MSTGLWSQALRLFGRNDEQPPADVLKEVRRLEIRTRGLVDSLYSGNYPSIYHGRGLEFSHVREYQHGDDVRLIDWKVTARRNEPYVRQFVEERDLLVLLIVDVSGSKRFGPGEKGPSEVAAELAAAIAFAAARNHDRISLMLVSDHVEHYVAPAGGRRHVVGLLADMVAHKPKARGTDLSTAFHRLNRRRAAERATVFVISDFIHAGPADPFRDAIVRLAGTNDVIAIRLISGATLDLPDVGWVEMTDPETGRRVVLNAGNKNVRAHYRHSVLRAQADMSTLLSDAGAELLDIDTASDPLAELSRFFRARRATPK